MDKHEPGFTPPQSPYKHRRGPDDGIPNVQKQVCFREGFSMHRAPAQRGYYTWTKDNQNNSNYWHSSRSFLMRKKRALLLKKSVLPGERRHHSCCKEKKKTLLELSPPPNKRVAVCCNMFLAHGHIVVRVPGKQCWHSSTALPNNSWCTRSASQ